LLVEIKQRLQLYGEDLIDKAEVIALWGRYY
jgi:hypothetical protein